MDGNGFAIAEGPTGAGATDVIYDSWVDGRDGVDNEHVLLSYSRTVAQTGRLRTRWREKPTTAAGTRQSRCRRTGPTRRGVLRLRRRRTRCGSYEPCRSVVRRLRTGPGLRRRHPWRPSRE